MLGQQSNNIMNQGSLINQSNNALGNTLSSNINNSNFMAGMYDRSLQDYVARQNQMDQARLASMGYSAQQSAAEASRPSFFEQLIPLGAAALGNAALFSDIRVKENIGDATTEIDQFVSSVKPYFFEYNNAAYGQPGIHYGVMAQELEQTPAGASTVVEDAAGVKMVDLRRLVPLMMASMGRMAERIEILEKELNHVR
jgi:hypothetical protein